MTMWNQRTGVLVGIFVAILVGWLAYGVLVQGWFSHQPILITYRLDDPVRYPRRRDRATPPPPAVRSVVFGMDQKYVLTSIRVEPIVSDGEAGASESSETVFVAPDTSPLWHIVTEGEGPKRLQSFRYGERIAGMTSAIEGQRSARPLEPDTPYRIVVEAGSRKAELEFRTEVAR